MKTWWIFLIVPFALWGTDRSCWYERDLQPVFGALVDLEYYEGLDSGGKSIGTSAFDQYLTLSLSGSYDVWAVELEGQMANAGQFFWDSTALTGRWRFLNDVVADPVSLVAGLTITSSTHKGRLNLGSFHSGGIDFEGFVSVGKECSYRSVFCTRGYGVVGIGGSDLGRPWMRLEGHWEKNFCQGRFLELFFEGLIGFGSHKLKENDFYGWGPIQHRSVDLGIKFTKVTDFSGVFRAAFARRVWAYNYPRGSNLFSFEWNYPFGI